MFPGSVNSPLHRTGSSNACSPNSVLKLWEPLNARVSMCLKVGDEAADPQSRNSSKIQGHRTATRLWVCSITILGWPAFLQHLSIWDLILKWEDHQNNFHNDPTSSGLTVRKRNADRIPERCQEVKDIRSQRNASKSSITPIWMWEKRQEPSSSSSGGRCRKRIGDHFSLANEEAEARWRLKTRTQGQPVLEPAGHRSRWGPSGPDHT